MNIALAQLNYHIGNFSYNVEKIKTAIKTGKLADAGLIVFSELAVCGYPPQDLLEKQYFIENCQQALHEIASHTEGITVILGSPMLNPDETGKNLFNSAYVIQNGKLETVVHKTLLPTYDIFDEYRYFEPNNRFGIVTVNKLKIALTICEDLWYDQPVDLNFGKGKLYSRNPMEELMPYDPDLIINIAASPFAHNREKAKRQLFINNAKKYNLPVIFVNQVGANTELIFEGGSMVLNRQGTVVKQLRHFAEAFEIIDADGIASSKPVTGKAQKEDEIRSIHDALILGIRDYFSKMTFKNAVIGLSGGIDSAVTAALAARALGKNNLRVLLMPSQYSTAHSISDAEQLAVNLDVQYDILSIEDLYHAFNEKLKPVFGDLPPGITEENIQSRIRAILLMAVSNKFGHILLNTSNKSEAAVGYGTLYGDMAGGLSVLGDVYKTRVYELARYINRNREIIPENTLSKPPSAELKPGQKDSDSLPDYGLLDSILFHYIEMQLSASQLVKKEFDRNTVEKVIHLVNTNDYKRFQTPPMLRVTSKGFGTGRRIPIVAHKE